MTKPTRHQRFRAKGSRLPDGVVCVTRPGKWGNPYKNREEFWVALRAILKNNYLSPALRVHFTHMNLIATSLHELTGKDLACWCSLEKECHADDLLTVANNDRWIALSEQVRAKCST